MRASLGRGRTRVWAQSVLLGIKKLIGTTGTVMAMNSMK